MISYIKLNNFKSLNDVTLDLRDKNGIPKKMAFIYGENGAGKSNLISSLLFISQTFETLTNQEKINELNSKQIDVNNDEVKEIIIKQFIRQGFSTLSGLIKKAHTIGCKENMRLELGLYIHGFPGIYILEFNNEEIIYEELKYQISERMGIYFKISPNSFSLSPSIFHDKEYKKHLEEFIDKYWGKHTFISILFYEIHHSNKKYFSERIHQHLTRLLFGLKNISVLCNNSRGQQGRISLPYKFMRDLDKGKIDDPNDKELKAFEAILDTFFTTLYSDIKKAFYVFTKKDDSSFQYELTFSKLINGRIINIPCSLESTGTLKLLDIFPFIFASLNHTDIFIDEIESGIHDILISTIIDYLEDAINGQFIATTHNTLLMNSLPQEYIYIIQTDYNGNKEITCMNKYSFRTQQSNNKQKKYLSGTYKGVPNIGYLDFEELVDDIKTYLKED